MQSVADYVTKVKSAEGFGYWLGTYGQVATDDLWTYNYNRDAVKDWYRNSSHADELARWKGKRVLDCVGLDKYARWVKSDGSVPRDSATDLNDSMMLQRAKDVGCKNGLIDTLPLIEGICLYLEGHFGVLVKINGVWYGIESRGGDYGVVKYEIGKRPNTTSQWTKWSYNPFLEYGDKGMLYKGCPQGEAVKEWQEAILKIYPESLSKYGADSDFGGETEMWTNTFKKSVGLTEDGKVDELTYGRMLDKISQLSKTITVVKEVPVTVIQEKIVEVPVEVIREVQVEVPVEVIKEVSTGITKEELEAKDFKIVTLTIENFKMNKILKDVDLSISTSFKLFDAFLIALQIVKNMN